MQLKSNASRKPYLTYFFVFLVAVLVFCLRRIDQIIDPAVWNEDGIYMIPQAVNFGFASLFFPANG